MKLFRAKEMSDKSVFKITSKGSRNGLFSIRKDSLLVNAGSGSAPGTQQCERTLVIGSTSSFLKI